MGAQLFQVDPAWVACELGSRAFIHVSLPKGPLGGFARGLVSVSTHYYTYTS